MVDQEAIVAPNPLTPEQQAWYEARAVKRDYQIEMLEAMRDTAREKQGRLSLEIAAQIRERELDAAHIMIIDLQGQLGVLPTILNRLTVLEAERDEWRNKYNRCTDGYNVLAVASRDGLTLIEDLAAMRDERDAYLAQLGTVTNDRDALTAECDDYATQVNKLTVERDSLAAQKLENLATIDELLEEIAKLKGYDDTPPEANGGGTPAEDLPDPSDAPKAAAPPEWDTRRMTHEEKATAAKLYAEQYSGTYSKGAIAAALRMSPSNYYKLANGKEYHKKAAANRVRPATAHKRRPTDAGINYAVNFASDGVVIIPA